MFSKDQVLNAPFHAFIDKLLQINFALLVKQGKLRQTLTAVINSYTQARNNTTLSKTQLLECIICACKGKTMAETNCRHSYCYQCIIDWHKQNNKCPSCREGVKWLLIRCAQRELIRRHRGEWIKAGGSDWLQVMSEVCAIKKERQRERSRSNQSEESEGSNSLDSFIDQGSSSISHTSSQSQQSSESQPQALCTYCLDKHRKALLVLCQSCSKKQLHIRCLRKEQLSETRLCKDCLRVFKSALS